MDEFRLIETLFATAGAKPHRGIRLGIGDDASLHAARAGFELVVCTDASVAGVHWPEDYPLDRAAKKSVALALADLAAMGAEPEAVWCALVAPSEDAVIELARGIDEALRAHDVALAGGDLVRGEQVTLALTAAGWVPEGEAMRRDAACAGEILWLCGKLGLAHIALAQWLAGRRKGGFLEFFVPKAPLKEGVRLRELGVRCCIDVSDGLLADAQKLAVASGVGLEIDLDAVPSWSLLVEKVGIKTAIRAIASGGEDGALLFTAPAEKRFLEEIAAPIGRVVEGGGVRAFVAGEPIEVDLRGYVHF